MLNIASDSVNMPKIKPETKVLIIKNLKSKSPPEEADILMCLNSSWWGFTSATKRLAMSMTDPGGADNARQLLKMTACQIVARNGLHGLIAAQKPALNKRQLRNRVAYTKAHSLTEGWTAEN